MASDIGLLDVGGKIPNLALMKIAAWHVARGDNVELFNPLRLKYDCVYVSKITTWARVQHVIRADVIVYGGPGASPVMELSAEVENQYPDYALYGIDYAMGQVTRGCINHCPWCIVPAREGHLRLVHPIETFWRGQDRLMLLDAAITDCPAALPELRKIQDNDIRLDLTQGFNVRTVTHETAATLADISGWDRNSQWHISWDNPGDEKLVIDGIDTLNNAGIPRWKIMCYVLAGFNTTIEQDLHRVRVLESLGIDPFVMAYRNSSGRFPDRERKELARWCNRPQIRKKCTFEEYHGARHRLPA